jgi:GT2 family glycosyltransferase
VGGLEEQHLQVAFNDVDLCLRIRQRGYRIIWTPYAELYHLESASRGLDNTLKKFLRLRHELNYMKSHWAEILLNDPYYNPNLTIEYEDFSLAYPPRVNLFCSAASINPD